MSEPTNGGELLLPVCIPEIEIRDLISAIDLYRVMRKGGQEYAAFNAVLDAIDRIDAPETAPCLPTSESSGTCFRMDTTTEIFEFYPNNPFDSADDETTSTGMSWVRLGDVTEDNLPDWLVSAIDNLGDRVGYFPNDCFISYNLAGNRFQDLIKRANDFFDALRGGNLYPFPITTFRFRGVGQIEIEFAQVPFGGAVIVVWDFQPEPDDIFDIIQGRENNLDNFQLIELNRDVIGIPPEFVPTAIFEQDFDEDIEHVVQCFFSPRIEPDQAPFFFPFAGIREVEFCGVQAIGAETGNTYNQFNFRDPQAPRKGVLPVSTEQDFYDALERYETEKAVRWLLGQGDNVQGGADIEPGKDGGKSFDIEIGRSFTQGRTIELPQGTTADEIAYGQALQVGTGFRNLVNEVIGWQANSIPAATIVTRLFNFYVFLAALGESAARSAFESDLAAAITAATANVTPVPIPDSVANFVFCGGPNKQSLFRYALDVEENAVTDGPEIAALYRLVIESLDDSQIDAWYNGPALPSLGFVNAPCYTFPVYEYRATPTTMPSDLHLFESGERLVTSNRLYRIEISGSITLADGIRTYDGAYVIDGSTANYFPSQLKVSTIANGNRNVTLSPQPIRGTDGYKFDALVVVNAGETLKIEGIRTGGGVQTPSAGELIYTIYDLGGV